MAYQTFEYEPIFILESGKTIPGFSLAYNTYGKLNEKGDNAVWIFHALTASSDASDWWQGLVGPSKVFDPERSFIVCANMPGSCYGSTGPLSINPETDTPFFHEFPWFTTRDMIRAYQKLRLHLGIKKIFAGIGGSMGGQQLLEWAIEEPELFEHIIPIATNARHSPWGKAFNASQRLCIEQDPSWKLNEADAGTEGMKTARSIALLSYRHYSTYQLLQEDRENYQLDQFRAESYQRYQGQKLAKRFNAFSYYFLSKSMDAHDVGRGREGLEKALQRIEAATLVIGIETDVLFPLEEQKYLAEKISNSRFEQIGSVYGHDGFLLEFEAIEMLIRSFIPALNHQPTETRAIL